MSETSTSESPRDRNTVEALRESALTGIAIVIPGLVTVYVLELVVGFVLNGLEPYMELLVTLWPGLEATPLVVDALGLGTLAVLTVALGFVVHYHAGEIVVNTVDGAITRIPGIGTLYGSVRRITDTMLVGDDPSFTDVKLVEVPSVDHHMLGFVTSESPSIVGDTLDGDVTTLFVPMAPNPVMAGFVIHASEEQLTDVDMTVEQGMSAIVSLGAAETSPADLSSQGYGDYR